LLTSVGSADKQLLPPVGSADKHLLPPNRRKQLLIHSERLAHAVSVASLILHIDCCSIP